jgi:hypothetical protein
MLRELVEQLQNFSDRLKARQAIDTITAPDDLPDGFPKDNWCTLKIVYDALQGQWEYTMQNKDGDIVHANGDTMQNAKNNVILGIMEKAGGWK